MHDNLRKSKGERAKEQRKEDMEKMRKGKHLIVMNQDSLRNGKGKRSKGAEKTRYGGNEKKSIRQSGIKTI